MKPSHPAANDNLKDELIRRTCEVWQPRLGRDLSCDEVDQIAANVTGFFTILAEWSRVELSANDAGKLDASENDWGAVIAKTIAKTLAGRSAGGAWTVRCPGTRLSPDLTALHGVEVPA